ncbi:MAG: BREX-3 system P-loop-containing protein BrxF [Spirochaetales bacterium]|nr:BREX-3 system P-loop-containing protein BrxF [Spirochaetales bacterium]
MINDSLFRHIDVSMFQNALDEAIAVMSHSSNKLVLVLRDKLDIGFHKAVEGYVNSRHIGRINIGLALSSMLQERDIEDSGLLARNKMAVSSTMIVDNCEILFDSELKLKPFQLLKNAARHQVIVAVVDAQISEGAFLYGNSSSGDFCRYEQLTDTYILDLKGGE